MYIQVLSLLFLVTVILLFNETISKLYPSTLLFLFHDTLPTALSHATAPNSPY